ncbi:hypothetical protein SEA_SIXAMA_36 [Gordonia phage Sixama]|uniref:Uncharacterized protein n=1 Tax=Gordonia phage Sixama TaxID=2653271 RepID=A0A5Q2F6Y3_9CAUD|nr:hypothetical protein PP302_gp036 [Gordonia phage Sixama]QGF20215.1 hypothetical protein SEA_SIXAMA_36 [Gordonia phage Sixama]
MTPNASPLERFRLKLKHRQPMSDQALDRMLIGLVVSFAILVTMSLTMAFMESVWQGFSLLIALVAITGSVWGTRALLDWINK